MIAFRAAPRHQHPSAGAVRSTRRRAPRIEAPEAVRCCGSPACPARANRPSPTWSSSELHARRPPHLHARRRQPAPRPQPRPRLHRCRSRREHPPRRRGGEAVRRCRADRALLLHLAVPRPSGGWCATWSARASSSRFSSTRRSRNACARDPKGLYAKAQAGAIKNFTGIDSPYEAPDHSDIQLNTVGQTPEQSAAMVLAYLRELGLGA